MMKRHNKYLTFFTLLVVVLLNGNVVLGNAAPKQSEKTSSLKRAVNQTVVVRHGITFKNDIAIFLNQSEMNGGEMFLRSRDIKSRPGKVLKCSMLNFDDANKMFIFDTTKKEPFIPILESQKVFCVKSENDQLFVKDNTSVWEPITMKYLKDIPEKQHSDEKYPCMLIEIRSKWFRGTYEYSDY